MNTNRGYAYDENDASPYDRSTVAAIFDTPQEAKLALKDLHDAGYKKTWMGVTTSVAAPADSTVTAVDGFTAPVVPLDVAIPIHSAYEHQVQSAGGGIGATLARFFGENTQQSLHAALTAQGVPASDAMALDQLIDDGGAVITVQVEGRYDEAVEILQRDRGDATSTGSPATTGRTAGIAASAVAAVAVAAVAASAVAAAVSSKPDHDTAVDHEQTIKLKEEQLAIDKQRVSAGEAQIEKRVVSEIASADVPLTHDELFIQRRAVTEGELVPSGPIGEQTVRVPLMREQVVVDKRTVVREEVAIGKRTVTETQHVNDTVRREELVVDNGTSVRTTP